MKQNCERIDKFTVKLSVENAAHNAQQHLRPVLSSTPSTKQRQTTPVSVKYPLRTAWAPVTGMKD